MSLNVSEIEAGLKTKFVGRRLICLETTPSTMDVAREQAIKGAPAGTVVTAEEQTAGRGRLGRTWVSPAGQNLYFTLILRPPPEELRSLTIITPLAISLAIERITGLAATIKWPNDVRVSGRKLGGVLIENEFAGSELVCSLVGPGINVNFDPSTVPEIADIATSVKRETGSEWPREPILSALLNTFEELYQSTHPSLVMAQWRARLDMIGQSVSVTFRDQTLEGIAEDVDHHGNLLLRLPDSSITAVEAGEVTLRRD